MVKLCNFRDNTPTAADDRQGLSADDPSSNSTSSTSSTTSTTTASSASTSDASISLNANNLEAAGLLDAALALGFNNSLSTKMIVHGFGSSCSLVWVHELRSALMAVVSHCWFLYLPTPLSTLGKSASPPQLRSRVDVSQFVQKNTVIESGWLRAGENANCIEISYFAWHYFVTNNSSGYRVREIFDVWNCKETMYIA